MLIYNLNLIIVYVSSFISRIFKQKASTKIVSYIFSIIAFTSMLVISGLRYYVGTDYSTYKNIYDTINTTDIESSVSEIGYYFLNKFIYTINSDSQMIFIATSFIILLLIFITVNKYCDKFELALYLYITLFHFYASFNVIRQYIAIAITFYAVRYIIEHKFYKYLIAIIIASSFHTTAIIMIPFYFICKIKMDTREYLYGSIIGIISLLAFEKIFELCINLIPRYTEYKESVLFTYGSASAVIVYGIIFIIIYMFRKSLIELDDKNIIYMNFLFVSVLISILTIKGVLFARIAGFFNIYAIILIPNLVDLLKKKEKRIIYYSILCVGYLYCYLMLRSNQGGVLPFRFVPM